MRFHSALLRNKTYSGRVQKCNPLLRGVTDLSLQKVSGQGCGSIWPSWRHPRIFVPPVMRHRVQDGFWGPARGGTAPRRTSIHPGQRGLRNGGGRGAKWEWAGCEMGEGALNPCARGRPRPPSGRPPEAPQPGRGRPHAATQTRKQSAAAAAPRVTEPAAAQASSSHCGGGREPRAARQST